MLEVCMSSETIIIIVINEGKPDIRKRLSMCAAVCLLLVEKLVLPPGNGR